MGPASANALPWDCGRLATLIAALGLGPGLAVPRIHDVDVLVAQRPDLTGVRRVHTYLDARPPPHRTAADAERALKA